MPKLAVNAFINKHKTGVCVLLQFFDFKNDKDRARKAGKPFVTKDGKTIPTPSQVITKLVASFATGDYAIQSMGEDKRTGIKIQFTFKETADALRLANTFLHGVESQMFKQGDGKPCSAGLSVVVEGSDQVRIAKELGLS